jgi:transposase
MLHRICDCLVARRTGSINAIRGHMAEFGVIAAQGQAGMKELLAITSELDDGSLSPLARELLARISHRE